jgi:hypothetical protein
MQARPFAILLCALALSCSGGSSPSSDGGIIADPPGGSSNLVGSFVGELPGQPDNVATMAEASGSGDVVSVDIDLSDVDGVFGAAFDVGFEAGMAEYLAWSPGDLFESDGDLPLYSVTGLSDRVVVGISRSSGAVAGIDVVGTRTMITLTFRVTQPGSSPVTFANATLLDDQAPPQTIDGIAWAGGTFQAD